MRNTLVMYHNNQKRFMTIRKRIYLFIILFGVISIYFPLIAHADVFGYEIQDIYAEITENVRETNGILGKAFKFAQTSPYDIVNSLVGTTQGTIAIAIRNATKTMALVVATILIMVEFVRKSINFEWASKWENILIFLIKIIIIKQIVQNADIIVSYIYAAFNSINKAATSTSLEFLPCDNIKSYYSQVPQSVVQMMKKGWWDFWVDIGAGDVYNEYYYDISLSSVKMFYPNAVLPADTNLNNYPLANPTKAVNFMPTWEMVKLQPFFLTMKAIAYIVFVITIGRVFELALYTIFAPLPLSTFASDTTHEVAKNFIKNYIATVLQIAVIVTMFLIYTAVNKYVVAMFPNTKLLQFVVLISLGLSVVKSGAWSRKVCGIV